MAASTRLKNYQAPIHFEGRRLVAINKNGGLPAEAENGAISPKCSNYPQMGLAQKSRFLWGKPHRNRA